MKYNIITISREHGSGGRLVGKRLSAMLSIPMYDKKLLELAAQESGFSEDFIQKAEQKRTSSFIYDIYFNSQNPSVNDQVFLAQSRAIREMTEKGPCIIAGRCADYVLRDRRDCLNVFLYAPMAEKVRRLKEVYGEAEEANAAYLEKFDKRRRAYYEFFTDRRWGEYDHYHLMIDTTLGIEAAADLIRRAARGEER